MPHRKSTISHLLLHQSVYRLLPVALLASLAVPARAYTCQDVVVTAPQSSLRIQGAGMQLSVTALGQPVTGGVWNTARNGNYDVGVVSGSGYYTPPGSLPSPASSSIYYNLPGCNPYMTVSLLNPVPVVSWPEPAQVIQQSSFITLHGNGFEPGATLTVNGQPTTISYLDSARIQFTLNLAAPTNGPITAVVTNPSPGAASGQTTIQAVFPKFTTVTPTTLVGGVNTLTINGAGITDSSTFSFDGQPLYPTKINEESYTVKVFVAPWRTGTIPLTLNSTSGAKSSDSVSLSIQATTIPFETAARFSTQAAFGPRIDIVQHIQNVGMKTFLAEQRAAPAVTYTPNGPLTGRAQYLIAATSGNTLLRLRVAAALQTFVVNQASNYDFASYVPWQRKVEADALGNFRQMLTDAAQDARMGAFLNLAGNNAPADPTQHPNQNFARELMQLFSIGPSMLNDDGSVQVDNSGKPIPAYDQNTVLDMARALTGWQQAPWVDSNYVYDGIDYSQNLVPNDRYHDHGAKTLFGTVQLPGGQDIVTDRTQALDAVFNHPNVPPFVSRQLIQHLVKSNPSAAYVRRIAKVFENNGKGVRGDMTAVVSAILLDAEARVGDTKPESVSDGFLEDQVMSLIFAVSTLGQNIPDSQPGYIPQTMGESLWYPPSVNGFYANTNVIPGTTTVSPEFALWNNMTLTNRSQVLYGVITGTINGFGNDYMRYVWLYQNFSNVTDLVTALNHLLFYGRMTTTMQSTIISTVNGLHTSDKNLQFATAIFLAMNSDANNVQH